MVIAGSDGIGGDRMGFLELMGVAFIAGCVLVAFVAPLVLFFWLLTGGK